MRMSCNGCRILRKGCSDNCSIRPCLQWIKSPESQANATMFLAKFYGRAGLTNLINAGPEHLHPAIFRSLLYEACGRIVNPIHGSVGLLWSGNWQLCQAAVEAVLNGTPITPITSETAVIGDGPPLKAYDIRYVSKDDKSAASNDLHRTKSSYRFKHSGRKSKPSRAAKPQPKLSSEAEPNRSTSHESALSHQSEPASNLDGDSKEIESMVSEGTAEPLLLFSFRDDSESAPEQTEEVRCSPDIGLGLSLGLEPMALHAPHVVPVKKRRLEEFRPTESDACKMELGL